MIKRRSTADKMRRGQSERNHIHRSRLPTVTEPLKPDFLWETQALTRSAWLFDKYGTFLGYCLKWMKLQGLTSLPC
jgi:hypothetical protein